MERWAEPESIVLFVLTDNYSIHLIPGNCSALYQFNYAYILNSIQSTFYKTATIIETALDTRIFTQIVTAI